MTPRFVLAALIATCWPAGAAPEARGAVVVVANRTRAEVRFTLTPPDGEARPHAVAANDLAAIPLTGPAELAFGAGPARRRFQVIPDTAYYVAESDGALNLREIGLAARPDRPRGPAPAGAPAPSGPAGPPPPRVLTVKLFVDQKEPAARPGWEKRLRGRVEMASAALDHICRVTLKVVAVEEWQSDDAAAGDLHRLLADFERKVRAGPAQVAVGFSSQPAGAQPDRRVGGTRAALHPFLLLREWRPTTERGRVDVLLHELGHYLGAAHSPEPDSIMRPALGNSPLSVGNWHSGFDPVNALVMNIVAEEVFDRGVKRLGQVSPAARARLREVYGDLARALPEDPTAGQHLRLLGGPPVAP